MNTEEKAKAYDEALERAWRIKNGEGDWRYSDLVEITPVLTEIFPQLRESEDEKRMRAIAVLEQQLHFWNYEGPIDKIPPATKRKDLIEAIDVALSYLEKQKEQESAEWSEEDADILNGCISSIEEAKENRYAYKETDGDTSYDREIDWLKSLRPQPHWKPSEEQIATLEKWLKDKQFDGDLRYVYPIFESLYNDLKKLM